MSVQWYRYGGVARYGHHFGWWCFRVTIVGSATYRQARKRLPLAFLPWQLLDAGSHLGRRA